MKLHWLLSTLLFISACSRVPAPGVPNAFERADEDADANKAPGKPGKVYTGEDGALGGIGGTLPSGAETDPLETGMEEIPRMDPVIMEPEPEIPVPTDPKPIPDPTPDPRSFRTLSVSPGENHGIWEGFGVKLGEWANAVGATEYQDTYADLFFSTKNTAFTNTVLPGLGLTIVRYGIGGGGRPMDIMETAEIVPADLQPYRQLEGFWTNPSSEDAASESFDWNRDVNQRSMLIAAKDRGIVNFEFYSAAPMWWMTAEKSAFGGRVEDASLFARYLATVTQQAREDWAIPVTSLAPFNEPSSDRWTSETKVQGSLVDGPMQANILGELQKELLARDLAFSVSLSGSDEHTPRAALNRHEELKRGGVDVYEKINVHTADRGRPSRDLSAKEGLRIAVAEKRIWVSDHSDQSTDGMSLAASIVEDIHSMKATAWIYGQAVDSKSSRSLVLGEFEDGVEGEALRGRPSGISIKHYVLAHFSRFIRPGQQLVGGSDSNSLVAYDPSTKRLSLVILNATKTEQDVDIDLSAFKSFSTSITHVVTRGDGMKLWKAKSVGVLSRKIRVNVEAGSVSSVEIPDAILN